MARPRGLAETEMRIFLVSAALLIQLLLAGPFSPPAPPAPTDCDVVIVGAGPGGLYSAYRLAPLYGVKLCVIESRDRVGGKVFSYKSTLSTPTTPIYTPTHAEQLRGGDTILRCLQQELGSPSIIRGSVGSYLEARIRGRNSTGYQCFGNVTPSGPASCAWGNPYEGVAPNGWLDPNTYVNLVNPCGSKDWTACSYEAEYYKILGSANNANTISQWETFGDYTQRILNAEGRAYIRDVSIATYQWDRDYAASFMVDYLKYDGAYPQSALSIPQGGPQQSLWLKMRNAVLGNLSRLFLNETALSLSSTIGSGANSYPYTLGTNLRTFRAKRVILGMPSAYVANLTGNLGSQLASSKYIQYTKLTPVSTWNAFFPFEWWQNRTSQCVFGNCAIARNFTLSPFARKYTTWSFWNNAPGSGDVFIQFIGTPERQAGHLLRIFIDNEATNVFLANLLATSGQAAIQTYLMPLLRAQFNISDGPIPDPVDAYFHTERYGYSYISAGADFSAAQQTAWSVQPLGTERICLASESYSTLDTGWQEGATHSAHNCFRGKVFSDVITNAQVSAWERCSNGFSGRQLDNGNKNTGNDVCLLLANEYHLRDLANLSFCGGPSVYAYANSSYFNAALGKKDYNPYANVIMTPVYEATMKHGGSKVV